MPAKYGAGATVAQNRRARFDYHIEDTVEAGMVLTGTEVKSLRANSASLGESYAGPKDGAIYLINAHIPEYQQAGIKMNHEPRRPRKLLLHKREQERLMGQVRVVAVTLWCRCASISTVVELRSASLVLPRARNSMTNDRHSGIVTGSARNPA